MSATRIQTRAVADFSCLGDRCPDTCCKGWGMQVAPENIRKWEREAPELLATVTSGEAEFVMKRDAATDNCLQFDAGWCGLQQRYGSDFLGDACHFYPRINRALSDTVFTSIALSCPEAARLMLYGDAPFTTTGRDALRQPFFLTNYLPETVDAEAALATHQSFIEEAGRAESTAERNLMRLSTVARALEHMATAQWHDAARFYFTMADGRLPQPEAQAHDWIHLVQACTGLVLASQATNRPKLMALLARMQEAVGIHIDAAGTMQVMPDAAQRGVALAHRAREWQETLQPLLKRYLQAQISQALFPYAGLGSNLTERLTIIAIRFATLKLALLAGEGTQEATVETTYLLSRFMDHLADPALSLSIYRETGWVREARLRGLLGDA